MHETREDDCIFFFLYFFFPDLFGQTYLKKSTVSVFITQQIRKYAFSLFFVYVVKRIIASNTWTWMYMFALLFFSLGADSFFHFRYVHIIWYTHIIHNHITNIPHIHNHTYTCDIYTYKHNTNSCNIHKCIEYKRNIAMGWLRLVGSLKLQLSSAEYRLFYRALLQKRPII